MTDADVIIIGAGVAGLSAAKALQERGISYLIFEASHRIGGRAYSESLGQTWFDLGCSYLHEGEINPVVDIARQHGFHLGDGHRFEWDRSILRHNGLVVDGEARASLASALDYFDNLAPKVDRTSDVSLADLMDWDNPHTPVHGFLLAGLNASDASAQSAYDYLQTDLGLDIPVQESLGRLFAQWAANVSVHLNTAVHEVNWSGKDIVVTTSSGTARAKKVIVTVSTGILHAGNIRFSPELPESHLQAITDLPCGVLNKIGVEFTQNSFAADLAGWNIGWKDGGLTDDQNIGTIDLNLDGPVPQAVVFAGGGFGAYLERQGDAAMKAYAQEMISTIFGADASKQVTKMIATAWAGEPMTLGSYSYGVVGSVTARKDLGTPIDQRLYISGEATSLHHNSTCHGALLAGIDAAHDISMHLERAS